MPLALPTAKKPLDTQAGYELPVSFTVRIEESPSQAKTSNRPGRSVS